MRRDHIHTPSDGRGRRVVYVNGKEVERVVLADTRRGVVFRVAYPYQLTARGHRMKCERICGQVTVEPLTRK